MLISKEFVYDPASTDTCIDYLTGAFHDSDIYPPDECEDVFFEELANLLSDKDEPEMTIERVAHELAQCVHIADKEGDFPWIFAKDTDCIWNYFERTEEITELCSFDDYFAFLEKTMCWQVEEWARSEDAMSHMADFWIDRAIVERVCDPQTGSRLIDLKDPDWKYVQKLRILTSGWFEGVEYKPWVSYADICDKVELAVDYLRKEDPMEGWDFIHIANDGKFDLPTDGGETNETER